MIHSLIGQNERWAQIAALQPLPGTQAAQPAGSAFSNAGSVAADPTVVNPISSGSGSALTNDTNFLLLFLNGGSSAATGSNPTGSNPAGTGGSSSTQTAGAPDDTSATQGATSLEAQLLTDVQSFVTTLGGSPVLSGSGAPGSARPAATSSLAQDIDAITSAVGTVAVASLNQPAPSKNGNDIDNSGSTAGEPSWRNGWDDGRSTGAAWRQQFGLAAYAATDQSGQTASTTTATQSITT